MASKALIHSESFTTTSAGESRPQFQPLPPSSASMRSLPAACPSPLDLGIRVIVTWKPVLRLVRPLIQGSHPGSACYRVWAPLQHASHCRMRTARAHREGGRSSGSGKQILASPLRMVTFFLGVARSGFFCKGRLNAYQRSACRRAETCVSKDIGSGPTERLSVAHEVIDDHEIWRWRSKRVSLIVACESCF